MFHRSILSKLNASFYNFVETTKYFVYQEQDEQQENAAAEQSETDDDDAYFEEIEISSYLRAFKALSASDTLYQLLHVHILTKQIDLVTKEAYQVKG